MEFRVTHTYDCAAATALAIFTDYDSVRAKYEALGHTDVELVSRERAPDGAVTVVTHRTVPLELPGFAKKVLSPRQRVTQTDSWSAPDANGVRTGTFTVVATASPVQVHGTLMLTPTTARSCSNVIHAVIECRVPLVGGKIAALVANDTRRAVDHEQTWTRQHIAAARPSAPMR